jgi:hypothetical protein
MQCTGAPTVLTCPECQAREPKKVRAPWERHRELGLGRGFYETARDFVLAPRKFFSGLELSGGTALPFAYLCIILTFRNLLWVFWDSASILLENDPVARTALIAFLLERSRQFVTAPFGMAFFIGLMHLSANVWNRKLLLGWGMTTRVVAYTAPVHLLQIPIAFIPGIDDRVLTFTMFATLLAFLGVAFTAAGMSAGRALATVGSPLLALACCFSVAYQSFSRVSP